MHVFTSKFQSISTILELILSTKDLAGHCVDVVRVMYTLSTKSDESVFDAREAVGSQSSLDVLGQLRKFAVGVIVAHLLLDNEYYVSISGSS